MEKIITVYNKTYKAIPENDKVCTGCSFLYDDCLEAFKAHDCCLHNVIFQEVTEPKVQQETAMETKPVTIPFNLELDFSSCILPDFFKVKSLKVPTLDEALLKGTDSFLLSTKNLTQEQVLAVAEGLRNEFIKRNTKVHDV